MRLARALPLALLLAWSRAAPRVDDDDHDDDSDEDPRVKALKAEINALSPQQLRARFGAVHPKRAAPPRQSKIDHFVVLFIENHAADNIFGCMDLPGFDGIRNHTVPNAPPPPAPGTSISTYTLRPSDIPATNRRRARRYYVGRYLY